MDREAFAQRVLAMERTLYRVARTLLKQDADCADAVQEAILRALNSREKLREERYFQTWMVRILINVCYDMLCAQTKREWVALDENLPAADGSQGFEVRQALEEMSRELRLPLMLYYLEGFSVKETAKILGLKLPPM